MRFPGRQPDLTCLEAVQLVTDYLDEALPTSQHRTLQRHLALCPHCAEYLRQIQATIAASGRIEPEQLSAEIKATLIDLYRRTR